jgi:hypothetical protein
VPSRGRPAPPLARPGRRRTRPPPQRRRAPSSRSRPPGRRQGSTAVPPPSTSPKLPGGPPWFGCPSSADGFSIYSCPRREAGSSAGNSGGKALGGRFARERRLVASKGARGIGLALPRCAGAPNRILPHRGRHGKSQLPLLAGGIRSRTRRAVRWASPGKIVFIFLLFLFCFLHCFFFPFFLKSKQF